MRLKWHYRSHAELVLLPVVSFSRNGGIFQNRSFGGGMSLTDVGIKRAKVTEKTYRLKDSGGLFLFVTPAGGKLWRWKYWFEGKQKLITLSGTQTRTSLKLSRCSCGLPGPALAAGLPQRHATMARITGSGFSRSAQHCAPVAEQTPRSSFWSRRALSKATAHAGFAPACGLAYVGSRSVQPREYKLYVGGSQPSTQTGVFLPFHIQGKKLMAP